MFPAVLRVNYWHLALVKRSAERHSADTEGRILSNIRFTVSYVTLYFHFRVTWRQIVHTMRISRNRVLRYSIFFGCPIVAAFVYGSRESVQFVQICLCGVTNTQLMDLRQWILFWFSSSKKTDHPNISKHIDVLLVSEFYNYPITISALRTWIKYNEMSMSQSSSVPHVRKQLISSSVYTNHHLY